jgi:hypothetical protein
MKRKSAALDCRFCDGSVGTDSQSITTLRLEEWKTLQGVVLQKQQQRHLTDSGIHYLDKISNKPFCLHTTNA